MGGIAKQVGNQPGGVGGMVGSLVHSMSTEGRVEQLQKQVAHLTKLVHILWKEAEQGRERILLAGGDEIVVVDQQVQVGSLPPATVAQLFGGDVGPRQAFLHHRGDLPHQVERP